MDRPKLHEVWAQAMDARVSEVMTARPGRVEAIVGTAADIRPMVWAGAEEPPVIPSVPISHLQVGTAYIALPVEVGDTGLLLACDADIAEWRRTGEGAGAVDTARHHLQNSVFIPCLQVAASDPAMVANGLVIKGRPNVLLGGPTAGDAVIKGSSFVVDLNNLLNIIATWAAALQVATGVPDTVTPAVAAFQAAVPNDLSTEVWVK